MAFAADNDAYLGGNNDKHATATAASVQTQTEVIDLGDDDESNMNDTNSFFCFQCMKNHLTVDLFMWSNCNHHYSRDCALFEIRRQLYNGEMPKCVQDKSTIPTYLHNGANDNNDTHDTNDNNDDDNNNSANNTTNNADTNDNNSQNDNNAQTSSTTDDNTNPNTNDTNTTNTNANANANTQAKDKDKGQDKDKEQKNGKPRAPSSGLSHQPGPCNQYLLTEEASTLLDTETFQDFVRTFRKWRTSTYLPNKSKLLETSNMNDNNSPFFVLTDADQGQQGARYEFKIDGTDDDIHGRDDDSDSSDDDDARGGGHEHKGGDFGGGAAMGFVSFDAQATRDDNHSSSSEADVAYDNPNQMTFGYGIYDVQGRSVDNLPGAGAGGLRRSNSNEAQMGDDDEKERGISGLSGAGSPESKGDGGGSSGHYADRISSLNSSGRSSLAGGGLGLQLGAALAAGDMLGFGNRMRGISMGVSVSDRRHFVCQHCQKREQNKSQFDIFEWCPVDSTISYANDSKESKESQGSKGGDDRGIVGRCGHQLSRDCAMSVVVTSLFSQQLPRCPCKLANGKGVCNHYLMENEAIKLLGLESELFTKYAELAIEKNAMSFEDYNSMAALTTKNMQSQEMNTSKNGTESKEDTADSKDSKESKESNGNGNGPVLIDGANDKNVPTLPTKLRQSFTDESKDLIEAVVPTTQGNSKDIKDATPDSHSHVGTDSDYEDRSVEH